ncbi:hypothetical protein D3C72_1741520 [compost metagenome]
MLCIARLLRLLALGLQLLARLGLLRLCFIALTNQFLTLLSQVIDLLLALAQQTFQIGEPGLRNLTGGLGPGGLLAGLGNLQMRSRLQCGQLLTLLHQHLALAGQRLLDHTLSEGSRLLPHRDKGLRHFRR